MRDFSRAKYIAFLEVIKKCYTNLFRFDQFLELEEIPESFCLIRHDVDRKPENALWIASVEHEMEIASSFYFRTKPHTFKPEIISAISEWGHEIGYHYESLSDTNGNVEVAIEDFKANLERLRNICPVKTFSMHGRPLKSVDNRSMWNDTSTYQNIKNEQNLLGEIYLEIDYTDIAYVSDTGRTWIGSNGNLRDNVHSNVQVNHTDSDDLFVALQSKSYPKLVFQIHPERWEESLPRWLLQYGFDISANLTKSLLKTLRQ